MRQGFVIGFKDDNEREQLKFWDGATPLEDVDQAHFFESVADARVEAGQLQAGYTTGAVIIMPASYGIQLKEELARHTAVAVP